MRPFRVVELQRPSNRIEDRRGHPGEVAPLEFGAVLDADPGQHRHLGATQTRHAPWPGRRESGPPRGDLGSSRDQELANLGAVVHHTTIEAVGTQESMMQAIRSTRPGGHVGYVGVSHDVSLPGEELFFSHVHLHGGPAPVRRFLPDLLHLIGSRHINPGKVFDLELPLDEAAVGYRAMDQRHAIKVLLRP